MLPRQASLLVVLVALLACRSDVTAPSTVAPELQILPSLGGSQALIAGISADGSTATGVSLDDLARERAFRWTTASGVQDLGSLGGDHASANGISPDGTVIVGTAVTADGRWEAFRWTGGAMLPLGTLGGTYSEALAATSGGVVVGVSSRGHGSPVAFRWTEAEGMQELGDVGANAAVAVSADGSVVAGSWEVTLELGAFQWTAAGGMVQLATPSLWLMAQASAISADGSVIVGWAAPPQGGRRGVRWTEGTMSELGTLGGRLEQATAVSPEGDVVVGFSGILAGQYAAFRWTEAGGMENLNDAFGDVLPAEWRLISAFAVSSRGRRIAGMARSTLTPSEYRAFVLDTGGR